MVKDKITSIAPLLTIFPFSTVSICSSAPVMAMNNVLTPQHLVRVSWTSSFRNFPNSAPPAPPATMASVLIMVPKPCMVFPSLS